LENADFQRDQDNYCRQLRNHLLETKMAGYAGANLLCEEKLRIKSSVTS
jgi:hypothetical protein